MGTITIGIANHNPAIASADIVNLAAALDVQVKRDLRPAWGVDAEVVALADPHVIPSGVWPLFVIDELPTHYAGYHEVQHGVPIAFASCKRDWRLAASHECIEMLVDPSGVGTMRSRAVTLVGDTVQETDEQFDYLIEACDPMEDLDHAYAIDGILVSDFYTRNYFDAEFQPGVKYSHNGAVTRPREVRPNGYLSWIHAPTGGFRQLRRFGSYEIVDLPASGPAEGQTARMFVDQNTKTPRTHPELFAKP